MSDKEFDGKLALVTGAGGGIGLSVARALAEAAAAVTVIDCDEAAVRDTTEKLQASGADVRGIVVDVSDSAAVTAAVAEIESIAGPVDFLVNVAGVLRLGTVVGFSDEDWRHTFAVNTDGVFYMSRAVASRMAARGSGAIVTVASNAARVPRVHMAAYGASKAASSSFTKSLGLELGQYGVRCNVVDPGSTDTPMLRSMWRDGDGTAAVIAGDPEAFKVGIPLGKVARPADIADAVVFLLSDRASHITMQELCVDGGAALGA